MCVRISMIGVHVWSLHHQDATGNVFMGLQQCWVVHVVSGIQTAFVRPAAAHMLSTGDTYTTVAPICLPQAVAFARKDLHASSKSPAQSWWLLASFDSTIRIRLPLQVLPLDKQLQHDITIMIDQSHSPIVLSTSSWARIGSWCR